MVNSHSNATLANSQSIATLEKSQSTGNLANVRSIEHLENTHSTAHLGVSCNLQETPEGSCKLQDRPEVSCNLHDTPDVIEHMEAALRRGGSRFTMDDLMRWLYQGHLQVVVTETMSASWLLYNGIVEIGHMGGKWNSDDVRWMIGRMKKWMADHGLTEWRYAGRPGWPRFLQLKGIET